MSLAVSVFEELDAQITMADVVKVDLNRNELCLAYQMAKAAEIGGKSRIRSSGERQQLLSLDQFIGVGLGELAGNKHFFTVKDYYQSRKKKNENPYAGDNGSDTIGHKIDYKASHAKKEDLLSYNLVVRPNERHEGFVYVLILVKTHGIYDTEKLIAQPPEIYLIGWATDDMLDGTQQTKGVFGPRNGDGGAYLLPIHKLRKIADLKDIPK